MPVKNNADVGTGRASDRDKKPYINLDNAWKLGDKLNQDARRALWAEMENLSDPLNLTQVMLPKGSRQHKMMCYFLFKACPKR
jgi:hypothetical protein